MTSSNAAIRAQKSYHSSRIGKNLSNDDSFLCNLGVDACKQAHLSGNHRIEPRDARRVIQDAEIAYQDYTTKELELLDEISDKETGLGEAATLLRSPIGLIVGEPKAGEPELLVHPLAKSALARYQLKKRKAWA